MNKIPLLSVFIVSIALTSISLAGPGNRGPGAMKEVLEKLDLKPEQKELIQEIHKTTRESRKAQKMALRQAREAFDNAVKDPNISDQKLRDIHETFVQAKVGKMKARLEKMISVRKVLDPEQRQEFQAFMERHHNDRKGKRKKWRQD